MSADQDEAAAKSAAPDPLMEAARLVGLWLYHFGRMEAALDKTLARLFDLSEDNYDVVTANIDIFRKVSIVRTACNVIFGEGSPESREADTTMKKLAKLNDERIVLAHSPFEPDGTGGVQFRRTIARQKLDRQDPVWPAAKFESGCLDLQKVAEELEAILTTLVPYKPSLDFSDSRNSMYIPLIV